MRSGIFELIFLHSPLGVKFLFLSTLHDTVCQEHTVDARFEPGTAAIHCANILQAIDNTKCDRMYSFNIANVSGI